MQSTRETGPEGKKKVQPQANPEPKGRSKEKQIRDSAEEADEFSRQNELATRKHEEPRLGEPSRNPSNPKPFKNPVSDKNDQRVAGKKREPAEMPPYDPSIERAMKYQNLWGTDFTFDRHNLPLFAAPMDPNAWHGTNFPLNFGSGFLAQFDPETEEGTGLQMHLVDEVATKSPVVEYTAPAIKRTRGSRLRNLVDGRQWDESRVGTYPVKWKSKAAAKKQHHAPSRQPASPPQHLKVTFEQRSPWCALCGSMSHGTGECPGGYDMRHGDVPICPNCQTTSANNMKGHTLDTTHQFRDQKDWGCRWVREAAQEYKTSVEARKFLVKLLLVDRKGKAPVRAEREENCFVRLALDISRQWCGNEMPEDIGYVWPLTKEDAVRHADALRHWDNLDPEERPRSSLDGLEICEIRRLYHSGEIPPQVFRLHDNIRGVLSQRDPPEETRGSE